MTSHFNLRGAVVHTGDMVRGHYTNIIVTNKGLYKVNDTIVTTDDDGLGSDAAYILLFLRGDQEFPLKTPQLV